MPANLGLYAQDQWTLDRLTLNLGVRWDYFNAAYPDHDTGTSRYRPVAASFPGQQVVGFKDIQPRLGLAYDLLGNGRTALKASFGRYADRDSNARAGSVNPADNNNAQRRTFIDFNQSGVADCDPLDPLPNGECISPSDNLAFGQPVVNTFYDPAWAFGWGTRHANYESSVSLQHEVAANVSVTAGWFHRSFVNFAVQDNRAVGPNDFGFYSVTAPADDRLPGGGGYALSGFADVNPDRLGQFDTVTTGADAFGGRSRTWAGFDLSVDARLDTLLLRGGLSTGRTSHDNCAYLSSLPEAHAGSADGNASPAFCRWSTPYLTQMKLLGSYTFPYGITFRGDPAERARPAARRHRDLPERRRRRLPRASARGRRRRQHQRHRAGHRLRRPLEPGRHPAVEVLRRRRGAHPGDVRRLQRAERERGHRGGPELRAELPAADRDHARPARQVRAAVQLLTRRFLARLRPE